jgi:hypothetical protein
MQPGDGVCGSHCKSLHFETFINAYSLCSIINGVGGILLALTYFPKQGSNHSKKAILGQIDYVGAFLSISGLTLLSVFCHSSIRVEDVYADANK